MRATVVRLPKAFVPIFAANLLVALRADPVVRRRRSRAAEPASAEPWITADPNPAPAGGGPAVVTIAWSTGDGSVGQVWIEREGQEDRPLAQQATGSKTISGLRPGSDNTVRLYAGTAKERLLASVVVTRLRPDDEVAPVEETQAPPAVEDEPSTPQESPPAPAQPAATGGSPVIEVYEAAAPAEGEPGRFALRWSTGDGSPGQLFVSVDGAPDKAILQAAPAGDRPLRFLRPGPHFRLRLQGGADGTTVLAETEFQRSPPTEAAKPEPVVAAAKAEPAGRPRPAPQAAANVAVAGTRAFVRATIVDRPWYRGLGGQVTVAWSTGDGVRGQLYRVDRRGSEQLVAEGVDGTCTVGQLDPTAPTELRLYTGRDQPRLIARTSLQRPFMRAAPNPVPSGDGRGTTLLSWSTGDGSPGSVSLVTDGGEPREISGQGEGTKPIPWIAANLAYQFRLHPGRDHERVLASVTVTRGNEWREVALDVAVLGALAAPVALVTWGTYRVLRLASGSVRR